MLKQEVKGEKKYGINSTGADELLHLEKNGIDISHATIYMPVSYSLLEEVLQQLIFKNTPNASQPNVHFLDMGCGKGRALCVAAHFGFKKVTGLDFSKNLCDAALENLRVTKLAVPNLIFKVVNNDAYYFDIPSDADCIFFFNPFDEFIMNKVVENIIISIQNNPRKIKIIYVNPLHKNIFLKAGYKETWHSKTMKYLEASILENN